MSEPALVSIEIEAWRIAHNEMRPHGSLGVGHACRIRPTMLGAPGTVGLKEPEISNSERT